MDGLCWVIFEYKEEGPRFKFSAKDYKDNLAKNPDFVVQVMNEILNRIILNPGDTEVQGLRGDKHIEILNELWKDCTPQQKKMMANILPDKVLRKCKSEVLQIRQEDLLVNAQNRIASLCAPTLQSATKVLFINPKDYYDEESRKGLELYVSKHPGKCHIVHSQQALEAALTAKQGATDISLVLMSDNNRKDHRFLDWNLVNAGRELGIIIGRHECIGHVRLITCMGGLPNKEYMSSHKPLHEKRAERQEGSARMTFIYNTTDMSLPYTEDSMAAKIWREAMRPNSARQLSLSASPTYLHLNQHDNPGHFIGSDKGAPFGVAHGYSNTEAYERLKSITLSTEGGMKARKLIGQAPPAAVSVDSTTLMLQAFHPRQVEMHSRIEEEHLPISPNSEVIAPTNFHSPIKDDQKSDQEDPNLDSDWQPVPN